MKKDQGRIVAEAVAKELQNREAEHLSTLIVRKRAQKTRGYFKVVPRIRFVIAYGVGKLKACPSQLKEFLTLAGKEVFGVTLPSEMEYTLPGDAFAYEMQGLIHGLSYQRPGMKSDTGT